jgi:hypothetical protein
LSADVKNEHNVTPRAPTDDGTKVTAVGRQSGCGQLPTTLANHEARLESLRLYYVRILNPMTDVFLVMEHCGAAYVGTLFLNDTIFCREIFEVLLRNVRKTILQIGEIDLGNTLEAHLSKLRQIYVFRFALS